jgi:ribosomal-protein-alanine N-acetyltransferase
VARPPLPNGRQVDLRRPTARDRDEFIHRALASRRFHRPWGSPPSTNEEFEVFLRRSRRPTEERFLVRRQGDDALVGVVNLSQIFLGPFRNAYLGYYAFVPFAGRGYMHEALRLAIRHAFGTLGLHRLEANIQPGNDASIALVRGVGFRREGYSPRYLKVGARWRDHERWAITVEEVPASLRRA